MTQTPRPKMLLTSFATWMPHQRSNSSDDLLETLEANPSRHLLRQLPADFEQAPRQAIDHIQTLQPDIVVCCGMAESRSKLTVESRAVTLGETLYTAVDVDRLVAGLDITEVSHDAGRFACNWLYYSLLKHFQPPKTVCLFVHVPILTAENRGAIVSDFHRLIDRLQKRF